MGTYEGMTLQEIHQTAKLIGKDISIEYPTPIHFAGVLVEPPQPILDIQHWHGSKAPIGLTFKVFYDRPTVLISFCCLTCHMLLEPKKEEVNEQ